ncbi:hypothetical protein [Halomonas sp. H5]|uniref:hypothetical protein n=1 Tax=Halomonas sp. H5 TaxID=3423910 RepID=UPI003D366749
MDRYQQRMEAAFLAHCSPQAAYDWLFNHRYTGDEGAPWLFEALEILEYLLIRRNHSLIDLGIARFGHSLPMIRKVFRRGDLGTRCAALANPHVGPRTRSNLFNDGWLEEGELETIVWRGSDAELEALVTNRFLNDDALECLLERKEEFGNLSDEKYTKMLIWLGKNPRMSAEYDRRILDGWAEFSHGRVFSLAWELARHLPTTKTNAYVLYKLLGHTALPVGYDNPEEVLERWRIEGKPQGGGRSLAYSYFLRARLADVLKPDGKLLESDDPAVRESFYRRFSPWQFKDWPIFIEHDGEFAFDGMVENDELWRGKKYRDVLRDLAWKVPDPNSSMNAPNTLNAVEERKRRQHPEWFAEEDSEYGNSLDSTVRRIEKKLDKIMGAVEARSDNDIQVNVEAREIAENVERLIERMEDAGNDNQNGLRQEIHRLRDELPEARAVTKSTPCRYTRAPIWSWFIVISLLILILLR